MKNFLKVLGFSVLLLAGFAEAKQATDSPFYRAGNIVYISGQVAIDPATGKITSNNIQDQVKQIFNNLSAVAKDAGGNLQNIIKLNVYMKDIDKTFPSVKKVIPTYFKPPYPARTPIGGVVIGNKRLLEIDAVMYLPQQSQKIKFSSNLKKV